jgi:hypothetical protein
LLQILPIAHPVSKIWASSTPARASLGGGVTLALRGDIPRPSSFLVVAGIRQGLRRVHPVQLHPVRRQHCTLHATAPPNFPV